MQYYFKMEWDKAIAKFEESERKTDGVTNPSKVYIQRCGIYKQKSRLVTDETWSGIFQMYHK